MNVDLPLFWIIRWSALDSLIVLFSVGKSVLTIETSRLCSNQDASKLFLCSSSFDVQFCKNNFQNIGEKNKGRLVTNFTSTRKLPKSINQPCSRAQIRAIVRTTKRWGTNEPTICGCKQLMVLVTGLLRSCKILQDLGISWVVFFSLMWVDLPLYSLCNESPASLRHQLRIFFLKTKRFLPGRISWDRH